jgi:hypothetical protein
MGYRRYAMDYMLKHDIASLANSNVSGLLGVETATAYWGLSTFLPEIPIFLIKDNTDGVYFVECTLSTLYSKYVNIDNVFKLSDTLYITDPEQTVCDMVRFQRHEFHLFETLINAYDGAVDIERLERLAEQYDILQIMREMTEEAYEVEEEG